MAISQVWDNEDHTIIRQVFQGWWNVDDYTYAFEQYVKLVHAQPHIVHRMADFRESEGLLGNLVGVVGSLEAYTPPNSGMYVAISPTYQTQTVLEVASKVAPRMYRHLHFTDSLVEARHLIRQYNLRMSASA